MSNKNVSAADISAVMSNLAAKSVAKRHEGKTGEEISAYYSNIRAGRKLRKSAKRKTTPVRSRIK